MHDQFITAIAEGRRLAKDRVRTLADGRVYSGRMAKDLGLVDALGGFDEPVAGELAGIPGKPRLVRRLGTWAIWWTWRGRADALTWLRLRSSARLGPAGAPDPRVAEETAALPPGLTARTPGLEPCDLTGVFGA